MTMYFAVFATRRSDLDEWIVSLVSNEALVRVVGWRTLDDMPGVLDCRVKRVWLTRTEVFEVVESWGRLDAARGRPISDADKLPEPYRGRVPGGVQNATAGDRLRKYTAGRRGRDGSGVVDQM